jgi:MFS family permease
LPRAYWLVTIAGGVFTLARFSEAFLVLRAQEQGLPDALAPLVFVLMNVVFAACAYPAGKFADRFGGRALLGAGLAALICADLVLAFAPGLAGVALGVAAWGLHMALTQGVLAAMVAASAPAPLRGTAFGIFGLVCGVAVLAASALAGLLWDVLGSAATFLAGAAFTLVALGLLVRVSGRA